MKNTTFVLFTAALIGALVFLTSCWEVNLPDDLEVYPVVYVGTQQSAIITGVEGTATYAVNTTNIATSQAGTVQWYSDANGTIPMNRFPFVLISATVSTGSANRTLTVNIGGDSSPGTYYFRVTIDGIESNVGTLSIDSPLVKTVTVGAQSGAITVSGSVTFPVTTENIATSEAGTVNWYYQSNNGTFPVSAPTGVSTSVTTGSANRTLTVTAGMDTDEGTYYFRVEIDGVESNMGTLEIQY